MIISVNILYSLGRENTLDQFEILTHMLKNEFNIRKRILQLIK